jgi:sugar phosphate isomerase/epimerase
MMRLAISNIAWRPEESSAIYAILAEAGVAGLEIAPGLAFHDSLNPFKPDVAAVARFRGDLSAHGLELVSMQSLLFGAKDARLFGGEAECATFEAGLERAIVLAERLEIPNLVMGSPANRVIPADMERADAERIACAVFRRLGEKARAAGTKLALEPNPTAYGTNFLTTMDETLAFAELVDHPHVTVNFDIGALRMNREAGQAVALYERGSSRVSHVHVSEPDLAPAPQSEQEFGRIAQALLARGYGGWFSIEMRQVGEDNRENIRARANACVRQLRRAAA